MGNSSMARTVWLVAIALFFGTVAEAQYDDYDNEAAGELNYSDEEAAGAPNYSDEQAAGPVVGQDEVVEWFWMASAGT